MDIVADSAFFRCISVLKRICLRPGLMLGYYWQRLMLLNLSESYFSESQFFRSLIAKYLNKFVQTIYRLELLEFEILSEEKICRLYVYIIGLYRKLEIAHEVIPMLQHWVETYPRSMMGYRQLATQQLYNGNVEEAKRLYFIYLHQREENARRLGYDLEFTRYYSSVFVSSIGHISLLAYYAMCNHLQGAVAKKHILFLDNNEIANPCLLRYIRPMYEIIEGVDETVHSQLDEPWILLNVNQQWEYIYDALNRILAEWEAQGKGPLLTLEAKDVEHGWHELSKVGVPQEAWFVTLHIRDAKGTAVRHGVIDSYMDAIKKIVDAGGWVIRLGDSSMPKLPDHSQVIDYAHSSIKSDRLDIFLIGACRFYLGMNSGPGTIPGLFGKRCLQTNYAPLKPHIPHSGDMFLPMLFRWKDTKQLLTFKEILTSDLIHYEFLAPIEEYGVEVVPNTPDEITYAVEEMLRITECNSDIEYKNSPVQKQFQNICQEVDLIFRPMISVRFLETHSELL